MVLGFFDRRVVSVKMTRVAKFRKTYAGDYTPPSDSDNAPLKQVQQKPYKNPQVSKQKVKQTAQCFRCGDERHSLQRCRSRTEFKPAHEMIPARVLDDCKHPFDRNELIEKLPHA